MSAEGREAELSELFRLHGDGLAGAVCSVLGSPADTQEVVQDAFLRALRALRKGASPHDPAAWIFVVTINLAKDRRRRARRRGPSRSLSEVPEMELHAMQPTPGAMLEAGETLAAARSAIQNLSDAEKEVFLLRVSGELSFEATARALGIPVGTAKTRMRAALARLRAELRDYAPAAPTATRVQRRQQS